MGTMFPTVFTLMANMLGVGVLDDFVDKLSCLISALIFFISAILADARTHVSIDCTLQKVTPGHMEQFSESYCVLKETAWKPDDESMGNMPELREEQLRLQYYEWATLYMIIAALVFMIPKLIWKFSQPAAGIPLRDLCETTQEVSEQTPSERETQINKMASLLHDKMTTSSTANSTRLTNSYAFVKLLYLIIALAQFFLLNVFLGEGKNITWGWTQAVNLWNGATWEETGLVPRISYCDHMTREATGKEPEETMHCVMGVSKFNAEVFLFLWFWLIFLFQITLMTFPNSFIPTRKYLIFSMLFQTGHEKYTGDVIEAMHDFTDNYLTKDGQLALTLIKSKSNAVSQELVEKMFRNFTVWRNAQQEAETEELRPPKNEVNIDNENC